MSDEAAVEARPRVRVGAVILRDRQVLMAEHEKDNKRYWLLPGGGMQHGETLEDTVRRELWEEAWLRVKPGRVLFVNDTITPDGSRHILHITVEASIVSGEPKLGIDHRVRQIAWLTVEQLQGITVYPNLREPLIDGIRNGFHNGAEYLGNSWQS